MSTIKVRIDGLTPLLQSNGNQVLLPKAVEQKQKSQEFNPVEAAALGIYKLPDGTFGHPTAAFRSAFIAAAKQYKIGKKSSASLLAGALELLPIDLVPLLDQAGNPLTEYNIDVRVIVVNRGAHLPAAKPRFDDWHCHLTLDIDDSVWPTGQEELLDKIMNYAGRAIGVGSGRPEMRKLSFGKFSATRV